MADAVDLAARFGERASFLAGGTDLIVQIERGRVAPRHVIGLGRVPGLDGLFVASGCCVGGLSLSPAAGRALADLIVDGKSDPDLGPISVERFGAAPRDPADLEAACVAQYARRYTH